MLCSVFAHLDRPTRPQHTRGALAGQPARTVLTGDDFAKLDASYAPERLPRRRIRPATYEQRAERYHRETLYRRTTADVIAAGLATLTVMLACAVIAGVLNTSHKHAQSISSHYTHHHHH